MYVYVYICTCIVNICNIYIYVCIIYILYLYLYLSIYLSIYILIQKFVEEIHWWLMVYSRDCCCSALSLKTFAVCGRQSVLLNYFFPFLYLIWFYFSMYIYLLNLHNTNIINIYISFFCKLLNFDLFCF